MALLPEKLISRLNKDYALGEYQFGTVLQQCLASIANNPPSGACITLPVYPDPATAEAACGAITGNIYWDSGSNCVTYYNGVQWICSDYETLESNVNGNTAKINLNCANILNLTNQLTILSDSFNAHDHNGINSPKIDIKDLLTTAPANSYFFSNGSGIDCAPIVQGTKVELGGAIVSADAECIDFASGCFGVTMTAPGEVLVDIPKLPGILAATIANATCCANNTTSIANLSNTVVTINTQVIQNTTDINTLTNDFNTHTHDGVDSIQLQQGNILSIVGGVAMPNNSIICADGAGGWQVFTKDFLNIPVGARNVGTLGVGVFDQINGTDSFMEFRNVAGGDGIDVTLDLNDNIIVSLDKDSLPVAAALDPAADTILIYDDDLGACAKASIQDIVNSAAGASTIVSAGDGISVVQVGADYTVTNDHTFTEGDGISIVKTGDDHVITNDHTFSTTKGLTIVKTGDDHAIDLDLDGFTAVAADTLDKDLDFIPVIKADGSCVKTPVSIIPCAVGSIQQSILTEAQFQAEMGTNWVTMDGRDVTGSKLAGLTGNNLLPDATGQFLRTAGGSAGALGTIQADATARNGLGLTWSNTTITTSTVTNNHSFRYRTMAGITVGANDSRYMMLSTDTPSGFASPNDGTSGNHSHTFSKNNMNTNQIWAQDSETRPTNLTVNTFIKIDD